MKKLFSLVFLLLLAGCSKPLPDDKLVYAGEWKSKEMYLLILEDGTVSYQRLQRGGKTSINGPLQEFIGDDFIVGLSFLTTTFNVSQPPTLSNGEWTIIVDGVKLKKTEEDI
ncbi:hypothetical protein CWC11_13855 [Pseudoalteromonas sp. S3178]|uniref:hypothetical protein n=1 Tax=Pseudoalteromonas sp. S3178 TaxID=579532 RepID=UPI00110AFC46|nr:hypothetical protein [Pseudoalteromonas sp. S3178]TMP03413.1 hypothetical protein CWC11_13855 [Pseudoalteromonas sp. S3178]|tara:strand:+ start:2016 stop:2351 length:336 start_codon:yes stop_codon:yes gene_type:complete